MRYETHREAAMRSLTLIMAVAVTAACTSKKPVQAPSPQTGETSRTSSFAARETVTVTVRDPELERRAARLEFRVIEKEAQVETLQERLDDTRDEVVRTMAKLRTLASRAEAASAMAEADVALQSLRSSSPQAPEAGQAAKLVTQSTSEFSKQNYGGALYLANQAKSVATVGRVRLAGDSRGTSRAGETAFAVPVRLRVANRGNVREGPGTTFSVAFSVDAGTSLTGYSYTDEWVRVSDDAGRGGWIFRTLIVRP